MNRLRELRKEKKLTLKEVSSQLEQNNLKISPDALAKYERGEREPKLETWQKLADFFGVSVPYLQGIEPDFTEVMEKTKTTLVETLNSYYFEQVKSDELASAKNLKISVDKYLKLKRVSKYPIDFYSSKEADFKVNEPIKEYWLKYFNFLLESKTLVNRLNRYNFGNIQRTRGLANFIFLGINKQINNMFKTDFGYYYEHNYLSNEHKKHVDFTQNLLIVKDIKDLDKSFLEYKNYLDDLYKNLKSDLENGNPIKQDREKREQLIKFLAERKKEDNE